MEFYEYTSSPVPEGLPGDPEQINRMWYQSLTDDSDVISRLLKPKAASDYLLKIKADPLLDHPRLYRVALKRAKMRKSHNLLYEEFAEDFSEYLSLLTDVRRLSSDDLPASYVLARFYDAMCLHTGGGKVIIVSEVLRYFLYFMTLGSPDLLANLIDIPEDVQGSSQIIATRAMMMVEALDFDLDPRGIVPAEVDDTLKEVVTWQMRFVIGHEYAHHGLGHLSKGIDKLRIFPSHGGQWEICRRSWDHEFEADLHAILDVEDQYARARLTQGAVLFFLNLLFHERITAAFDPEFASIDTHPPTEERVARIVDQFGALIGFDGSLLLKALLYQTSRADALVQHFREHPNLLTTYGSIYLGIWKGPELIDRVDY